MALASLSVWLPALGDEPASQPVPAAQAAPFDAETVVALLELVIDSNPKAARRSLDQLAERTRTGELSGDRLQSLRGRLEGSLRRLVGDADHPLHEDAVLLAAAWGMPEALPLARALLADASRPEPARLAALRALVAARAESLPGAVRTLLGEPDRSASFLGEALAALGPVDDPALAPVLLDAYPRLAPALQPRVVELLTERDAWSRRLLQAVADGRVPPGALNVNQIAKLQASGDAEVTALVARHWGAVRARRDPAREQVIADMRQRLHDADGDPLRGEPVFHKLCGQCHKLYGKGQEVGPDLTANGRSSFEQLLSNVFDPSLVIGAAYQARTVRTDEGRVVTGLLVEDSPKRIVLKTQGGKLEVVPRDSVDSVKVSELSLMPEGVEKQLTPEELADLFALLTLDRHPSDPEARRIPTTQP